MPAPNPERPGVQQSQLGRQGLGSPRPVLVPGARPPLRQQLTKPPVRLPAKRCDGNDGERDAEHPQSRHGSGHREKRLWPNHTIRKNERQWARCRRSWSTRSGCPLPQPMADPQLCPRTCVGLPPLPLPRLPRLVWASENWREDAGKIRRSPNLVLPGVLLQQAWDRQAWASRSLPPRRDIVGEFRHSWTLNRTRASESVGTPLQSAGRYRQP